MSTTATSLLPSPPTSFLTITTTPPPYLKFKPKTLRRSTTKMSTNNNFPPPQNPTQLITSITKLLWGKSLPPQLLISTVRATWSTAWHLMMSQLAPSDPSGSYTRPASQFTNPKNPNPKSLHLYVGLPCPWAHRTLIVRAMKGLQTSVPISVASPGLDGSWVFVEDPIPIGGSNGNNDKIDEIKGTRDRVNGVKTLREVYKMRSGGYDGRCTVPMLWDVEKKEVVCNESYDIIEILNSGLNGLAENPGLDLAPLELREEIEEWNRVVYPNINNGVYR